MAISYFLLIVIILPLCFHNKYFDMVRTKADIFTRITGAIAFAFVLLKLICIMLDINDTQTVVNLTDKFALCFLIGALCSTVFSEYKAEALWGTEGWHVGTLFFVLCCFAYYLLSRYFSWKRIFFPIVALVNLLILVLGIGNAIGWDPLRMNLGIAASDYGKYLSTIGNVNWYSGYLCMLLALCTVAFCLSNNLFVRIVSAVLMVFCVLNGIACNSDSFFLGSIPIGIYMLYLALRSKKGLLQWIQWITILEGSMIILSIIKGKIIVQLDTLQNAVAGSKGICILLILLLAGILFYKLDQQWIYRNSKKIFFGIMIFLIAALLVVIVLANASGMFADSLLIQKFKIDGAWGTNRGYIWGYSLRIILKLNPVQILFGIGPDTYGIIFKKYYFSEMVNIWNKNVINAHCEMLQLLITNGILGVIAYYGMFLSAVKVFLGKNSTFLKAIGIAILSYLCYGLIDNIQGICTPMVFILLGVGMSGVVREKTDQK